jgi:hypothetical protein
MVPRFRLFLPSRQPIRRHPDWRMTVLPLGSNNCPNVHFTGIWWCSLWPLRASCSTSQ